VEAYQNLNVEQKLKVRDALYKNIKLVDEFVKKTPKGSMTKSYRSSRAGESSLQASFSLSDILRSMRFSSKARPCMPVLGLSYPLEFSIEAEGVAGIHQNGATAVQKPNHL